jgi:hypothetical protein
MQEIGETANVAGGGDVDLAASRRFFERERGERARAGDRGSVGIAEKRESLYARRSAGRRLECKPAPMRISSLRARLDKLRTAWWQTLVRVTFGLHGRPRCAAGPAIFRHPHHVTPVSSTRRRRRAMGTLRLDPIARTPAAGRPRARENPERNRWPRGFGRVNALCVVSRAREAEPSAGGRRDRQALAEGLCVVCSLRHFRLEICWSLSLGGWWPRNLARRLRRRELLDRRGPPIFVLVIYGAGRSLELGRSSCWQLWGRPASPARDRQALGTLRCPFAPTFPAGEMTLFIPWRVVADLVSPSTACLLPT